MSAAVRVGAPEIIAEFRTRQKDLSLVINENREVDPDGSIALQTYLRAYAQPAIDARLTLFDPYALASVGGVQNAQTSHQIALKAVQAKMNELRKF